MRLRGIGIGAVCLIAAACGNSGPHESGGAGGGGAATSATTSAGGAGGGAGGTVATTTNGTSSTASLGGAGGGGGSVMGAKLVVPRVIDLPYTVAGQGGSSVSAAVENQGDAPLEGITWQLTGDVALALVSAPPSLGPGETAQVVVSYAGAPAEGVAQATLAVGTPQGSEAIPVFAATGDPGLGQATWEDVIGAGGVVCGSGATIAMPAAPYPDGASTFTDPSVRVFLPDGYRDRGAHDVVLHFHGHNTTLAETLNDHLYQEHVWASGANAVLVVPQGPVNTASGDFGKLMDPGGLARLVREVLVALYRDAKIASPVLGELVLTSHSGGYRAVATNLDAASQAPPVAQVNLFDSLYGYMSTYESFAVAGHVLRSNYTQNGGTLTNNQTMAADLQQQGLTVTTQVTERALRDPAPVIDFAATTHTGSTRLDGAYGERLRWTMPHARKGPRIELREAVAVGNTAEVRWLSPPDEDTTGFVVEQSKDGVTWTTATSVGPSVGQAQFALAGGARVRVRAEVAGVPDADVLASDAYRVDVAPQALVVDGFDRILDGSFGGLRHDFAARIGEDVGPVATVSHRALLEDGFDLASWPTVIWLLGDESTGDLSLSTAEQQILTAYVDGGGKLIVSGSELAWDIGQAQPGAGFLDHVFAAKYVGDSSGSHTVVGAGPLASIASTGFAGAAAPYACPYPDVLGANAGGDVVLSYGNGKVAGVGVAGQAVLVGFPLELVDAPSARAAIVKALYAYVGN